MDRRDFLKASLAGVPFLLGFKLPEMTMVEELRAMLHDPYYEFFEDALLQVCIDRAMVWVDPKGRQYPRVFSLENLAREVPTDPYRRKLVLRGAVHFACCDRPIDPSETYPSEAYLFYQRLHEETEEDFHRLLLWWEHRGDEQIFRRAQRELKKQMAETARRCRENPV